MTAQITDSDSVAWVNGTCTITAVYKQQSPIVAPYLNSGGSVPLSPSCSVNGSGQLSATVTDVKFIAAIFQLTWQFTVCPNISQQAGKSACGVTQIPVTGASPSLTGQLNLPAPRIGGGVGAYAYADIEVASVYNNFYWNIISNTCRQFGTGWAPCATGGGSTGTVNAGAAWQLTWYPAAGNTVGPAPNLWMLNPTASPSQVSAFFATLSPGNDVVIFPPSVGQFGFLNPSYVEVIDMRYPALRVQVGGAGVSCDAQTSNVVTVTSGSNQVNVGADPGFGVGKLMTVGSRTGFGYLASSQNTWSPTITAFSFPFATLSSNAPFNYSGFVTVGTDNTAALTTIFTNAGASYPLYIPHGCRILTGPIAWNAGQSLIGEQMGQGGFVSKVAQDILQQPDTSGAGTAGGDGLRVENLGFTMDSPVDPTLPITDYDASGASTVRPPLYRPLHMAPESQDANNPCAPGWMTNCKYAVAAITQNSAVICTPNAYASPAVGSVIVFPYQTAVFTSTVSSTAGSCAGGSTARTMAAAFPNTSGYTAAQAEWFAGTAVQQITSTIAANPTLPLTVNLSLPTAPVPGFESNFASHGHVRFGSSECDYMGNGNYGTQIVLRRCNSIPGYTGPITVVPVNPCSAKNQFYASSDQPWPVTPTINSGDSTPSGANYFPGLCGGAAALSFPQANGNVYPGTGLGKAFLEHLDFGVSQATPQDANSTAAMIQQGNTASYGADFGGWNVNFLQYGIAQGPASAGMHGVAAVGPTGDANTYHGISIHAGYPLTFDNLQNSSLDRIDTYGLEISPYDGTGVGPGTCVHFGYTVDEQTGLGVTTTSVNTLSNWECEPEQGSNAEIPAYADLDQFYGTYSSDNFEGAFTKVGGSGNKFSATTMHVPTIDYGSANHFETIPGLTTQYITNTWPNGFMEWGQQADCSAVLGGFIGPSLPCAPGLIQPVSGRSIEASAAGSIFENPQSGVFSSGEWTVNPTGSVIDANPFQVNSVIDPTEPFTGRYAGCNLGGSAFCNIQHFDGFTGQVVIAPNGRIAPVAYDISADFKSATASGQFTLTVAVTDPGTGSCTAGSATLATYTGITTTTSWPAPANAWKSPTPVNFAGYAGCAIAIEYSSGTTTDQYRVGKFDFYPVPNQIPLPAASPTVGTSCLGPNAIIGANSSGPLSCFNGVVVQGAGSSPFQSLTTTGSNCGLASLSVGVLNIPPCTGSGSSGFPITLGSTSIGSGSSTSSIAGLTLTSSSINGVTPSNAGPATQYLDKTGNYSVPAGSSGTQTICSGTVSLGTSAIASGAAASTVTATCTGLLSTDNIMLDFNGSPLGVVGYQPSTSGTLTIVKWPTANVLNVAVVNNTSASVTPGAIQLNFRAVR